MILNLQDLALRHRVDRALWGALGGGLGRLGLLLRGRGLSNRSLTTGSSGVLLLLEVTSSGCRDLAGKRNRLDGEAGFHNLRGTRVDYV